MSLLKIPRCKIQSGCWRVLRLVRCRFKMNLPSRLQGCKCSQVMYPRNARETKLRDPFYSQKIWHTWLHTRACSLRSPSYFPYPRWMISVWALREATNAAYLEMKCLVGSELVEESLVFESSSCCHVSHVQKTIMHFYSRPNNIFEGTSRVRCASEYLDIGMAWTTSTHNLLDARSQWIHVAIVFVRLTPGIQGPALLKDRVRCRVDSSNSCLEIMASLNDDCLDSITVIIGLRISVGLQTIFEFWCLKCLFLLLSQRSWCWRWPWVGIDHRGLEAEDDAVDTKGYIIVKFPPYPQTSIASLIDSFTASDFLQIFTTLLEHSPNTSSRAPKPSLSTHLPVFKCFTVHLPSIPQVTNHVTKDVVHARPALPSVGIRPGSAAAFDTVLAWENSSQGCQGRSPLSRLTVGQVKVIFCIPDEFGSFPHPMAYVEWFTPLTSLAPDLLIYQISRSTCNRQCRASIIPITQIERLVHLIPKFGKKIDLSWSSENVLNKAQVFYVNVYFRHWDFVLFHYLDSHQMWCYVFTNKSSFLKNKS